ncbi:MAG: hypothetical protein JJD93_01425 [Ilumatobacteraceae bacterium]|nr:hypothetical protein [Ilumatobacteraceae bacterium]
MPAQPIPGHGEKRQQSHSLQQVGGDDGSPEVPSIGEAATVWTEEHSDDQLDEEDSRGIASRS